MGFGSIEALEKSLGTLGMAPPKAALLRLLSELRARCASASPECQSFFRSAAAVLSRMKGTTNAQIRLDCLFECVNFFHYNSLSRDAYLVCGELQQLAERVQDQEWIGRAANYTGIVLADTWNIAEAVRNYAVSIQISRDSSDIYREACTLINLGTALNYAGLYRDAIPCLERSIRLCPTDPRSRPHEPAAFGNLAQSFWYLGQYSDGFDAISESLRISAAPTSETEYLSWTIRESTYVHLALETQQFEDARDHAERCKHFSRLSGSVRGNVIGQIAAGLCEVFCGESTNALKLLENLLLQSTLPASLRVDVLRDLIRAYDHVEQPEKALQCTEELLKLFRAERVGAIESLLEIDADLSLDRHQDEGVDLRQLAFQEATLRTKIAESKVANLQLEMFGRLAITADLKEELSGEHGYRVGKLAALLGERRQLPPALLLALEVGARLHDIGKTAVPDRILFSKHSLNGADRKFVAAHALIGAEILSQGASPELRIAEEIARHHHEWWNGEGYPAKLAGKRIPIHARIVALADVFDALTHGRPYAEPWPVDRALEEIRARSGTQFDPELTEVFIDLVQRLRKEHADLDEYLGRAGRNSPFLQARRKIRSMLAQEREGVRETAETHH